MNDTSVIPRPFAATLHIIGVACGLGARDRSCETGPEALRSAKLIAQLRSRGFKAAWTDTIRPDANDADALKAVAGTCRRLAQRVAGIIRQGGFPIVLGGDHSCAIGTWKGAANAKRRSARHAPRLPAGPR
jgi:arginase family enzyme